MELESLSSSGYSCRQSKCRATISPTSYRSPESARATRACTSAAWHKPTTERLWITKPKLGWGSTPPPEPDAHCSPPRKARLCTWQTRNRESPSHLWVTTAWAQIRRWTPRLLLTRPLIRINTPPAQVYEWERCCIYFIFFKWSRSRLWRSIKKGCFYSYTGPHISLHNAFSVCDFTLHKFKDMYFLANTLIYI